MSNLTYTRHYKGFDILLREDEYGQFLSAHPTGPLASHVPPIAARDMITLAATIDALLTGA